MREKSTTTRIKMYSELSSLPVILLGLLVLSPSVTLGSIQSSSTTSATASTPATPTSDMDTCQCGVFLLGLEPLVFSAEAKPILSGMPVPANCSAKDDKLQCATICRRLIETMSQSTEDSPLVQTVVLAATKTLACQRFNESDRVPLPRNFDGATHHARLDGNTNNWQFLMGSSRPAARSDLTAENEMTEEETASLSRITQPKYLGGFYRWCDEHWIYAGVSLHEPLCCLQHLPKKCPEAPKSSRNGRRPRHMNFKCTKNSCAPVEETKAESDRQARLIIRRCKNNECSSEESELSQNGVDPISEEHSTTSTKASPTIQSHAEDEEEDDEDTDNKPGAEKKDTTDDENNDDFDTLNPFNPTPEPEKKKKPLNSTVVAEAFKIVKSLLESVGYGEVVNGITSVLPPSTAVDLLERVDVGGYLTDYQETYMAWPREFSMGYCYLEYSLYNVANEGIQNVVPNIIKRVFHTNGEEEGIKNPSAPGQYPQPNLINPADIFNRPFATGPPQDINNHIHSMPDNSFRTAYGQPVPVMGNRRVKRGVTVSRSYSGSSSNSQQDSMTSRGSSSGASSAAGTRRAVRRKFIPRARNAAAGNANVSPNTPVHLISAPEASTTSAPIVVTTTSAPVVNSSSSFAHTLQKFHQSSSFIPTGGQQSSKSHFYPYEQQPANQNQYVPSEHNRFYQPLPQQPQPQQYQPSTQHFQSHQQPSYNNFQQQPSPLQRSHLGQSQQPLNPQILTEYARPRRHETPVPVAQRKQMPSGEAKQGGNSGAANLMNVASMVLKTAMAANGGGSGGSGGGGGSSGGDQVTNMIQTALPIVSQFANSPMVNGMVQQLVTNFLTPPTQNKPKPTPAPTSPPNNEDDEDYDNGVVNDDDPADDSNKLSVSNTLESEEADEPAVSSTVNKPSNASPGGSSGGGGGGSDILSSLFSTIIKKYVATLFGGGDNDNKRPGKPSPTSAPDRIDETNGKPGSSGGGSKDIVDTISDVAKPFFMSYFGIVPGEPGFGKLRLRRSDRGAGGNGILLPSEDQDPGVGILDILFPQSNFPDSGNPIYNFGNRVVYAFGRANNPNEGLYCTKQYMVNKLWDYFRVGVRAVFKK